jgi:signal transduction histidine kinase
MQERARHIGGKLKIDSDIDEGTRVELRFKYKPASIAKDKQ